MVLEIIMLTLAASGLSSIAGYYVGKTKSFCSVYSAGHREGFRDATSAILSANKIDTNKLDPYEDYVKRMLSKPVIDQRMEAPAPPKPFIRK